MRAVGQLKSILSHANLNSNLGYIYVYLSEAGKFENWTVGRLIEVHKNGTFKSSKRGTIEHYNHWISVAMNSSAKCSAKCFEKLFPIPFFRMLTILDLGDAA